MKSTKLLLSVSLILLYNSVIKAQTFFLDSTVFYIHQWSPSLSEGMDLTTHFKELVLYDSAGDFGEYYTVERIPGKYNFSDTISYNLRVLNDSVFFSGLKINSNNDSFEINDLLIYDFTINIGDTLKVSDNPSGIQYQLIPDSIVQITFLDGLSREAFFWKTSNPGYKFYTVKGLGTLGTFYFSILGFEIMPDTYRQKLISICNKSELIYFNSNFDTSMWKVKDYCDNDSIQSLIDKIRSVSINHIDVQKVNTYPNPVADIIFINGLSKGEYKIMDIYGKTVLEGVFENEIKVSKLIPGLYHLLVETDGEKYITKIVKE